MSNKSILTPGPNGWAPAVSLAAPPKPPAPGQIGLSDPYHLFGSVGPTKYNPSALVGLKGLRIFDEMRRDEQIKAAVAFKKHAIMAAGWDIVSPEGLPDEWPQREFVMWALERMVGSWSDRIMDILLSIEYGYSVGEIVWAMLGDGPYEGMWAPENIVSLKPHSIRFEQEDSGEITQAIQAGGMDEIKIPAEKLVIMTYQSEWSNPYGKSDLRPLTISPRHQPFSLLPFLSTGIYSLRPFQSLNAPPERELNAGFILTVFGFGPVHLRLTPLVRLMNAPGAVRTLDTGEGGVKAW